MFFYLRTNLCLKSCGTMDEMEEEDLNENENSSVEWYIIALYNSGAQGRLEKAHENISYLSKRTREIYHYQRNLIGGLC